jgi:hypothetical protein
MIEEQLGRGARIDTTQDDGKRILSVGGGVDLL